MTRDQLPWALGWVRLGIRLTELVLLGVRFRRPRARRSWQGALMAVAAGATLVELYATVMERNTTARRPRIGTPLMDLQPGSNVPAESWRGSGLAEDIGVNRRGGEEGESEEVKQRMMEDAAQALGLPETR